MDKAPRVAIYARVSTQQQADEATIESQIDELERRVCADGCQLGEQARFRDEGYSGSDLLRPGLDALRDAIHFGHIDRVYVFAPDRLARAFSLQVLLLEEFKRFGVACVFLNQPIAADSAEGQLLLNMQGTFAEYERAKILERTRRGRRFRARQGHVSSLGHAPYGYRYIGKAGGGDARFEIVEGEAAWVRQMFRWVGVEGLSLRAVTRRLGEHQVPTRTGTRRWDAATVRGILRNPSYYGEARWGKTRLEERPLAYRPARGRPAAPRQAKVARATAPEEQEKIAVPALIGGDLFAAVAERLDDNRKRQREHAAGAKYLLSGLLACGSCGGAYCGRKGRTKVCQVYYRCLGTDKNRNGGVKMCANAAVGAELEVQVWEDVCTLLRQPERLRAELARRRQEKHPTGDVPARRKVLADLKKQLTRLMDMYQMDYLDKTEFHKLAIPLKEKIAREEKAQVEEERHAQAEREAQATVDDFETHAARLLTGLENADMATKRKVLKMLVKRIEIGVEEITITYKINPNPPEIEENNAKLQHRLRLDRIDQGREAHPG